MIKFIITTAIAFVTVLCHAQVSEAGTVSGAAIQKWAITSKN